MSAPKSHGSRKVHLPICCPLAELVVQIGGKKISILRLMHASMRKEGKAEKLTQRAAELRILNTAENLVIPTFASDAVSVVLLDAVASSECRREHEGLRRSAS